MLILPVRPQPTYLRIQENNDSCAAASSSTARPEQDSHLAAEPPSQSTAKMISVMPPLKPPIPKRPKLSLQTCTAASLTEEKPIDLLLSPVTDTPIYSNTFANAFGPPPSTPVSIPQQEHQSQTCADDEPNPPSSDISSAISSSSGLASPFPASAAYTLPLGARSILLNSPLPRRHLSTVSTRTNRRMFQPVKRVIFREVLEDIIPRKITDYYSENSDSDSGEKRPRAIFERDERRGRQMVEEDEGDVPSTPKQRRRKRRREWVWRPLDDEILAGHINEGMAFRHSEAESPSAEDFRADQVKLACPQSPKNIGRQELENGTRLSDG